MSDLGVMISPVHRTLEEDVPPYEPADWFWIVGGDETRAWSSAAGAYVGAWPADRVTHIASEVELNAVLERLRLACPLITADHVRAEAQRRMCVAFGARDAAHLDVVISNATREAVKLLRIANDRRWTKAEAERAGKLEAAEALIDAIRQASNAMEAAPPADYRHDRHWPT